MPPRTTPPPTTATLPTTSAVLMRDGPSALSHPLYAAIETRNPSPRAQDASVLTLPPARNSKDAGKCKAPGPVDGPRPGAKNISRRANARADDPPPGFSGVSGSLGPPD